MSLLRDVPFECVPPSMIVKFEVSQEGGFVKSFGETRMIMWSSWTGWSGVVVVDIVVGSKGLIFPLVLPF